jgi:hypothetical protein
MHQHHAACRGKHPARMVRLRAIVMLVVMLVVMFSVTGKLEINYLSR